MKNKSISIKTNDIDQFILLGPYDEHIDLIESKFDVKIVKKVDNRSNVTIFSNTYFQNFHFNFFIFLYNIEYLIK